MSGKCRDDERFVVIPDKYRFKACVLDFDPKYEEDEDMTEKIVDVELIDYKTGHIWYNNGSRSTNYELIPCYGEPLTLEELDNLPHGELVYQVSISVPENRCWMFVNKESGVLVGVDSAVAINYCERRFRAYRRPPKGT